jgi:hypothetical protein
MVKFIGKMPICKEGFVRLGSMATIFVGTCGFYYTDWLGPVYPEGTAKKDYLPLYAVRVIIGA